ncbi:hypothetical protein BsWGS_12978 [Bradybaena similaris]
MPQFRISHKHCLNWQVTSAGIKSYNVMSMSDLNVLSHYHLAEHHIHTVWPGRDHDSRAQYLNQNLMSRIDMSLHHWSPLKSISELYRGKETHKTAGHYSQNTLNK